MKNKLLIKKALKNKIALGCIGLASFYASTANAAVCEHVIQSEWDNGFVANILITNDTDSVIEDWTVQWEYDDALIASSWSADISGSNPYVAEDLGWNAYIYPGQTIQFGFVGTKNTPSSPAPTATVSGDVCPPSTPTPPPTPTPGPHLCGDVWQKLIVSGLNDGDQISISWNAGWSGELVGSIGNTQTGTRHFGYCGTPESFPPLELLILDSGHYSCAVIEEWPMDPTVIQCREEAIPTPTHLPEITP